MMLPSALAKFDRRYFDRAISQPIVHQPGL
jgi:hypothetical protein